MRQEVIKQEKKANFPTRTHKKIETEKRRKTIKRKKNTKQGQSGGPLPVFFLPSFSGLSALLGFTEFYWFLKGFFQGGWTKMNGSSLFLRGKHKIRAGEGVGGWFGWKTRLKKLGNDVAPQQRHAPPFADWTPQLANHRRWVSADLRLPIGGRPGLG